MNGDDKLTFNHFDSHPECLGLRIKRFIEDTGDDEMATIAEGIVLIPDDGRPMETQLAERMAMATSGSGTRQDAPNWPEVLRDTEGDPSVYRRGLCYMVDFHEFMGSVFCEWVYVVDVDVQALEVYELTVTGRRVAGRYASLPGDLIGIGEARAGVSLVLMISFENLRGISDEAFLEALGVHEEEEDE